jgi:hypothetical protein
MKRKTPTTDAKDVPRGPKRPRSGKAPPTTQTRISLRISKRLLDQAAKNEVQQPVVKVDHSDEENVTKVILAVGDIALVDAAVEEQQPTKKGKSRVKKTKAKKEDIAAGVDDEDSAVEGPEERPLKQKGKARAKKLKGDVQKQKAKAYGIVWGVSPYPKFDRPAAEECHEVVNILSQYHGDQIPAKAMPPPSLTRAGCGDVPAVHDALLRTLLSAATQTENANSALDNLVKVYGVAEEGVGKGSINWNAVRLGSQDKLFKTIQCAGLAGGKSRDIKKILDQIFLENKERCDRLAESGEALSDEVSRTHSARSSHG